MPGQQPREERRMGLDIVELVLEVEKAFSISIDDREASTIITVGDLCRYVLDKLGAAEGRGCLSNVVFYRLRRALTDSFGIDRVRVRPDTPVGSLLPYASRRQDWRRLSAATGLTLPVLERPAWVYGIVCPSWVVGLVATVGLLFFVNAKPENEIFTRVEVSTVAVVGFVVAIGVELVTRPLEKRLPRECERVRGLVEAVVSLNFAKLRAEHRRWTPDEVWTTVRRLVADQFDVPVDEVGEATRFVADLGAS
jgi:acyl carrier protein